MMNSEPFITIGLPTYNRADLLPRCIISLLDQKYTNWSLIVSDDASTDATPRIVKEFARKDSRIRYIRNQQKMGLPKNRNIICAKAVSNLIFFIEDDTVIHPDCLAHLANTFLQFSTNKKLAVVAPRLINGFEAKRNNSSTFNRSVVYIDKFTGLVYNNFDNMEVHVIEVPTAHACSLISKKAWEDIGGYDEYLYRGTYFREETDFYFRLHRNGYSIVFDPSAILYHLRNNSGGCRLGKNRSVFFYMLNHIIFLLRFFGIRCIYMIPNFIVNIFSKIIKRDLI